VGKVFRNSCCIWRF